MGLLETWLKNDVYQTPLYFKRHLGFLLIATDK